MRKFEVMFFSVLIIFVFSGCVVKKTNVPVEEKKTEETEEYIYKNFNVLEYNVKRCKNDEGKTTIKNIISFIKELNPDVIIFNEIEGVDDKITGWFTKSVNQVKKIADECGMYYSFSSAENLDWYGNAILSRYKIVSKEEKILPGNSDKPRSYCNIKIDFEGTDIRIVGTHLGLGQKKDEKYVVYPSEERKTEIKYISNLVKESIPTVIAGDMNAVWNKEVQGFLNNELNNFVSSNHSINKQIVTYPDNNKQIDFVFHNNYFETVNVNTFSYEYSDHVPVFVNLKLKIKK